MNEVLIDIRKENEWIRKHFENYDYVSINQLLACIEDLDGEIEHLKEELEEANKSEEEKYEEWKWEQADLYNDEKRMGLR